MTTRLLPRSLLFSLVLSAPLAAQFVEPSTAVLLDTDGGALVGDLFGWTVAPLGDVNADGMPDITVSAPFTDAGASISSAGRIYAISGADGSVLWSRVEGLTSSIQGHALETTDWNGDGIQDVVAGSPFNGPTGGRVWIYNGVDGTTLHMLNPSDVPSEAFGASLATEGDFDGNGVRDLAVASIWADSVNGSMAGRVQVFEVGSAALIATMEGPAQDTELGTGLAFLGDVNADGRDELVIGQRDPVSFFDGQAGVFSRNAAGVVTELFNVPAGMGFQLFGDRVDGGKDANMDGVPDFMVGDTFLNRVFVYSGVDGTLLQDIDGDGKGGTFGTGRMVDDFDGDGRADLALGAYSNDAEVTNGGRVFVFSGANGATLRTITPTTMTRRLGIDVRGMGDFDGDGSPDLVVGAYGGGSPGPPKGRAYVFSGHAPGPPNVELAGELPGDPLLADTGGDPTAGPLIGHPIEVFNLSIDCASAGGPGVFGIALRTTELASPFPTPFGFLWHAGGVFFTCSGPHAGGVVACLTSDLVVPDDPSLIGFAYTAQGFCAGPSTRLSTAITQTIGG